MDEDMTLVISPRPPVAAVLQQHVEDSALLRQVRSVLVRAPHVRLNQLRRLDDRLAAHLDGVAVAGSAGMALARAALERPEAGEVFTLGVRALESRDEASLERLLALAATLPAAWRGLASALGWVPTALLQGTGQRLLNAAEPAWRELGLAACRMHQADPGEWLASALHDTQAGPRAAALRAAGELGRLDLLPAVRAAMADDTPEVVFWAAWSACLLGERQASPQVLGFAARHTELPADRALVMLLSALDFEAAREFVRELAAATQGQAAGSPADRRLIRAIGWLGDVQFLPWLVERMAEAPVARLAGEAWSLLTGVDLARESMDAAAGESREAGEDPADPDVGADEDDSLPWPALPAVQAWMHARAADLPSGQRCFLGRPLDAATALQALRDGQQRQRALAALALCLRQPGSQLFPVAAPARRQQQLLATANGPRPAT